MTSDSVISSSRSFPSRVRSPTPEKTDTPPCSRAMLAISSWISTVLPTPAPPKRPILPPRTYGAIRSTTLIPVSKISTFGDRSWNSGGSRWIGQRSAADTSPFSSIGSPITFHSRPSVTSPTGTEIGAPVSMTSVPRARPSVESRATARTRSSPRNCCTSAIRSPSGRGIRSAAYTSGSCFGKIASITTPLISIRVPTLSLLPLLGKEDRREDGLGTGARTREPSLDEHARGERPNHRLLRHEDGRLQALSLDMGEALLLLGAAKGERARRRRAAGRDEEAA